MIKMYISAYESDSGRKLILKLYTGVENFKEMIQDERELEKEANIVLSVDKWEKINEQLKTTSPLSGRDMDGKILDLLLLENKKKKKTLKLLPENKGRGTYGLGLG